MEVTQAISSRSLDYIKLSLKGDWPELICSTEVFAVQVGLPVHDRLPLFVGWTQPD